MRKIARVIAAFFVLPSLCSSTLVPAFADSKTKEQTEAARSSVNSQRKNYKPELLALKQKGIDSFNDTKFEESIEFLSKYLSTTPHDADALVYRGLAECFMDDNRHAAKDFDAAIKFDPRNAAAYSQRANLAFHQEQYHDALKDAEMAVMLYKAPRTVEQFLDLSAAKRIKRLSYRAIHKGNWRLTVADIDKSDFERVVGASKPKRALECRRIAIAYADLNDKKSALAMLNKAIELAPNHPYSYVDRARLREDNGDLAGALADQDRASRLNPNIFNAYEKAELKSKLGDWSGAISDYRKAIKNPYAQDMRLCILKSVAELQKKVGDIEGAIETYECMIEIAPSRQYIWNQAQLLASIGKHSTAEKKLDFVLADKTKWSYPPTYKDRSKVRLLRGNIFGALEDFQASDGEELRQKLIRSVNQTFGMRIAI